MLPDKKYLFFYQRDLSDQEMVWGLLELGMEPRIGEVNVPDSEYTEEDVAAITGELGDAEIVMTKDFSAATAEVCHRNGRIYLSWIHDSPQRALYMKESLYDTNIIFMFDRTQLDRLKAIGVPNLFYMPLAGNVTRASALHVSDQEIKRFGSDVSFVGNLYVLKERADFLSSLPPASFDEVERILQEKTGFWDNGHTIFCPLSGETLDALKKEVSEESLAPYAFSVEYFFQSLVLAREAAMRERILVLNRLAEFCRVSLYTNVPDEAAVLRNVRVHGKADYYTDALKVFFSSKINLNQTLPSIETGVPLRVFDIMSVGGFVMSNDQPEAHELFVPDREIVLYTNMDELVDKTKYYLSHEKVRLKIAMNGYRRVSREYTVPQAMQKMMAKTAEVFGFS